MLGHFVREWSFPTEQHLEIRKKFGLDTILTDWKPPEVSPHTVSRQKVRD